jgi:hypothetical protein
LNKSVDWGVTRNLTGTTEYFYIFSTEGVLRDFADRFYVHRPSIGGFYNLTIVNLTVDDVAKYTCIDNAGIGPSSESVQLQVIDLQNCQHDQQATDTSIISEVQDAADCDSAGRANSTLVPVVVVLSVLVIIEYLAIVFWCNCRKKKSGGKNSTTNNQGPEQVVMVGLPTE